MNTGYRDKASDMIKERENDFIVTSLSSNWKNDEETISLASSGLFTSSETNCSSTESTALYSNMDGAETTTIQSTQNVQAAGGQFLNEIPSGEENCNSLGSSFITLSRLQVDTSCCESQKSNEQNYLGNISSITSDSSTSVSYGLQMTSTPMVVLLNNDKGKMETGFLLQSPSVMQTADSCYLYNRINGIYALAQANLVAQTQQDIAKQLTSITDENESDHTALKSPEETPEKENPDTKTFECEVENCNKIFLSEFQLKNHMEYHASRDKELVCSHEGCGRKFFWPAHLKYHKLTHENERNFQCNVKGCDKKFFTAQRLVVHSLTHTGERPFTCQQCNKGFTTAGNLKNHLRTHTGERPYACQEENCDKKFAEFSSLRKHELTHTGEKPFKCEECGKSFTQSGSRQMHMKKHAAEKSGDGKKKERAKTKRKPKNRSSVVVVSNREEEIINYQNLQVILSQGVSDQVVNVTTQTPTTNKNKLPVHVLNEMRLSKDIHVPRILRGGGRILQGKSNSNVVVLSQPEIMVPMPTAFQQDDTSTGGEIVYENDYTGEVTPLHLEHQQASIDENQSLHAPSKEQTDSNISEDRSLGTDDYLNTGIQQGTQSTIIIEQQQQSRDEHPRLPVFLNGQTESNELENPNLCTHVYVNRVSQGETTQVVIDQQQQTLNENLALHVSSNEQIESNILENQTLCTNVYINTVQQGETTDVDKNGEQEENACTSVYENVTIHVSDKDLTHNNIADSQNLCTNSKQLDINPLMELDDEQR